jgi:hypothetical protein
LPTSEDTPEIATVVKLIDSPEIFRSFARRKLDDPLVAELAGDGLGKSNLLEFPRNLLSRIEHPLCRYEESVGHLLKVNGKHN